VTLTVRARIFLLAIIPVLILALPVFFYFPQQLGSAARASLEVKLGSLGGLLGHTLAPDLERLAAGQGDTKEIRAQIQVQTAGLEDDSDVLRAGVYAADGTFLTGLRLDAKTAPPVVGLLPQGSKRALDERQGELRLVSRIMAREGSGETLGFVLVDASLGGAAELQSAQRLTALLVGGVALILGVLLALVLGAQISQSLTQAARVASEVGRGNLGIEVPPARGQDELSTMLSSLGTLVAGLRTLEDQAAAVARCDLSRNTEGEGDLHQAFAQMVAQQRQLVHELSETATELETSSHEILATLRDQEAGANEQASAVEEARRTMLSLLQASSKIASAAKTVHANAQRTQESSTETAERTGQLNQLTARIADVLIGITKIADRSDILALNAALEGTKAGEAGKGFILVAEEMRRLAENVLESVRDISELVDAIREASQASVLATEQGVKLSLETADSANQIRLTSQQQQSGTEMATQSMNEISQILTQALGGARQTTSAVEELNQRASRLRETLSQYVLEDGSSSA
jgi:methyl-accepting chemotaxis protein